VLALQTLLSALTIHDSVAENPSKTALKTEDSHTVHSLGDIWLSSMQELLPRPDISPALGVDEFLAQSSDRV